MECNPFGSIEQALEDLAAGKMIIVTDDEDRENEGDIIVSCKFASPQTVNFIAKNACGLICMPVSKKVAQKLNFDPMTANNTDNHCTAFTISVDHVSNSTGISAFDRSATAMAVTKDGTLPSDFTDKTSQLQRLPLYELAEQLYVIFHLEKSKGQLLTFAVLQAYRKQASAAK